MKSLLRIALPIALLLALLPLGAPTTARAEVNVYTTPGTHYVNGREWNTTCEKYSQTYRCRTDIKSTKVIYQGGRYVNFSGWVFNNLTYLSSPRTLWTNNPLGGNGVVGGNVAWTATDGRKWRTECDTTTTGRNGCRSYIEARVVQTYRTSTGGTGYQLVTQWVFNNLVHFGAFAPAPVPAPTTVAPAPTKSAAAPTTPPPTVYYANCTAVRAAGKAPIYRGQPGYGSHLDRDGDGVACES